MGELPEIDNASTGAGLGKAPQELSEDIFLGCSVVVSSLPRGWRIRRVIY